MKTNGFKMILLIVIFFCGTAYGQLAKNSWSLTFGGSYPTLVNHALDYASNVNFGGFIGIQRNFTEHVGIRFQPKALLLEAEYGSPKQYCKTFAVSGNLDMLFYALPYESVSPYLSIGVAPTFYTLSNPLNKTLKSSYFAFQVDFSFGVEWILENDWKLKTELQYVTVLDSKFDGTDHSKTGGIIGGPYNSYLSIDIGINYYFSKGEPSNLGQLYDGLKIEHPEKVDYDRIENIVKKYIPREVTKEIVVEKPVEKAQDRWVLVGVNFEFNSTKLLPESYPILFYAVQSLIQNPELKVEIQGYTDNIGSEKLNMQLSEKRAGAVRDYLVARGISRDRLTIVGLGAANPVADNKTADGRALNRRIEFKIIK